MRQRILKSMRRAALLALLAIILVAVVSIFMYYGNLKNRIFTDEKNIADLIVSAVERQGAESLWEMGSLSDYHLTYIDKNGEVLYDNTMTKGAGENYSGRPEIKDAFKYGSGENTSVSVSLLEKTYYYARRLTDGTVLCVAVTDKSEAGLFMELMPMLVIMAGVILFFVHIVSKHLVIKNHTGDRSGEFQREFSANVAHELKTPLTSISGYAEIMKSGMVKADEIDKFAGIIHSEALRLLCLIEDIIEISRLDENQPELEWEMVDLKELAEDNIAYFQSAAAEKEILVALRGESKSVYGVRRILNQMIKNLIENAIKYNKKNGSVEVCVDVCKEGVLFSVKDTGIGIAKEDQERVFERFYRVDKSRSNSVGGTGLGLSIVKHAAVYHNAKIEIESEPDMGTQIRVIFGIN